MKSFLKLEEFYDHASKPIDVPYNSRGHFNIIRVEDLQLSESKPVSFTRRSYFKVSLVSGHSRIHYADQTMEVTESALVFTNPMIPYFWEPIDSKQTGLICIFTEDFFAGTASIADYPIFHSPAQGVVGLSADQLPFFHDIFVKMQQELLGQRIKLDTPTDFAGQLNIHVNHLNKALKEITGNTTSALISARIMQEAKLLLKGTVWPVNDIAWSLGFDEPNHFSAFFKHAAAVTPKQYRQSAND
jgi:AraC family transcriptional activator of pobA